MTLGEAYLRNSTGECSAVWDTGSRRPLPHHCISVADDCAGPAAVCTDQSQTDVWRHFLPVLLLGLLSVPRHLFSWSSSHRLGSVARI